MSKEITTSLEDEAAKLYPNNSFLEKTQLPIYEVQRQAHITCATQYLSQLQQTGELLMQKDGKIEALYAEIASLK